jgi:hypothetical protein
MRARGKVAPQSLHLHLQTSRYNIAARVPNIIATDIARRGGGDNTLRKNNITRPINTSAAKNLASQSLIRGSIFVEPQLGQWSSGHTLALSG